MSSETTQFRTNEFSADDINSHLYREARRVAAQAGEYTNPDGTTNADNITDYIADEYFSIKSFKRRKDLERQGSNQRRIDRERVYEYVGGDFQVILLYHNSKCNYQLLKMVNGKVKKQYEFGFNQKKQALAKMLQIQKDIDTN